MSMSTENKSYSRKTEGFIRNELNKNLDPGKKSYRTMNYRWGPDEKQCSIVGMDKELWL